jgi:SAM-dependent methyltransferase
MVSARALKPIGLGLALLALLSTALWLSQEQAVAFASRAGLLSLLLLGMTVATTSLNLGLRWFRWHFLLRRFGVRLRTRASVLVYFATLPAILTPFYIGELLRSLLFLRQDPALKRQSVKVWLIERGMDAAVLAAACLWKFAGSSFSLLSLALTLALLVALLRSLKSSATAARESGSMLLLAVTLLSTSVLSWSLPMLALWAVLGALGEGTSLIDSTFAFSASTLLGAFSGIPGGIAIAGSAEILLLKQGHSLQAITWAVAIFRLGTVWFSVMLGATLLWRKRATIRASLADGWADHFNDLAGEYEGEIASHTREKLLGRKIGFMQQYLEPQRPRLLHGLDIGCGQGWYSLAMAQHGHQMVGLDASHGQVREARGHAREQGAKSSFLVASGAQLPLAASSFDFAYSINVLHHVLDEQARQSCFAEINTDNPLFRLYMSYLFPLLNRIDEGNERWISPSALPEIAGASWQREVVYFTFLPDFIPRRVAAWLAPIERWLERSPYLRRYSAHYMAVLVKSDGGEHVAQGAP